MSINNQVPDYDLDDRIVLTAPAELRAMAHPLRSTVLDLLLERAATVSELAGAVGRPKSTMAHHVKVLVDAGLLRVVRTRRVRAIDERFYGRTARLFFVGPVPLEQITPLPWTNYLADAAEESTAAYHADRMWANHRHARIARPQAAAFWRRVEVLVQEFSELPRDGDEVYGFVVGLYPTDHPTLPEVQPDATAGP
ncbi:ArsR/SmtB family transcription factor [Pseudonocardia xinjiangensis]|uniref:ArsR/SmtB family transcription factor n=1 Tax=Pseudonocardia xinjiangensis TaxID=75289 RepID=UPI003D912F77